MRFALTKDHLDFYFKHHYLELEGLLTEEECLALCKETLPANGYDCWRKSPLFKKVTLSPRIASIASELTKTRSLRLAFDQLFLPDQPPLYKKPLAIKEISSVQPTLSGLLIQLSPQDEPFEPLPLKVGSGRFFSPNLPLPLDDVRAAPSTQLLIVYARELSLYTPTPTDPHTHALKKQGYVFGDRVRSTTHPILH
ncbi:MAG: hypothetical protein KDK60_03350 [Chlamydiia bacterium]|nr:hypothetical protein [Chlamydiia bacterium]